ncbi:MAG: glycosyltransferase [Acidobacteriota bacterium]|nr:glycosyltransferase [Acidobacteriota bacterium]
MSRTRPHVLLTYHGSTPATHIRQLLPFERLAAEGRITFEQRPVARVGERCVASADVIVAQRLEHPRAMEMVRMARLRGRPVIYDTDDNWVNGPPEYHPAYESYRSVLVRSTVERYLRLADMVTVSTEALAETFGRYNPAIRVVHNTIDLKQVPARRSAPAERVTLGYSGTRTHEGDFEMIAGVLQRLHAKYGQRLRLVFLGFVPECLRRAGLPLEELGFQDDYPAYLKTLAGCGIDIALAPLLVHPFNDCKSAIKYLEYGSVAAAGVYSHVRAYRDTVRHGETGMLVDEDPEAWYRVLEDLIEDPARCRSMGAEARKDVEEHHDMAQACEKWMAVFDEVLARKSLPGRNATPAAKKVFYIGAGMLWPHTYFDEMLVRAFSDAGFEVVYWPLQPPKLFAGHAVLWERYEEGHRRRLAEEGYPVDRTLLALREEKPDLVFAIQGYALPRDILREIKAQGVPSAVWMMDEPYETVRSRRIGEFFDHVFVQDAATVEHHRRHGNPNTHFLAHGCDAVGVHRSQPVVAPRWDLSLVGSAFPHRVDLVRSLEASLKVLLVGSGWEEVAREKGWEHLEGAAPEKVAAIYRESRINLVIHRREEECAFGGPVTAARSPNGSLFHIAGCGGFVLVDDSRETLSEFFRPGREVATFHGAEDLRAKVARYLRDDEQRRAIAAAGQARAHAEHSYTDRIRRAVQVMDADYVEHQPEVSVQTMLTTGPLDRRIRAGLVRCRVLEVGGGAPGEPRGGALLTAAAMQADSPYLAVVSPGTRELPRVLERLRDELGRSPDHAAAVAFGAEGWLAVNFSLRLLWRLGGFDERFRTLDAALRDRVYALERQGLRWAEVAWEGRPIAALEGSDPSDRQADDRLMERKWGADPGRRLTAGRLFEASRVFEEWEHVGTAHRLVLAAVELDPGWAESRKRLAQSLFRLGQGRQAVAEVERAWADGEDDPEAGLLLALARFAVGRVDQALAIYRKCENLEAPWPIRASIQAGIARCLRRQGLPEQALERLERALVFDPIYVDAFREKAACLLETGRGADALEAIERAVALRPRDPALQAERARVLQQMGRIAEARRVLDDARSLLAPAEAR